MGIIRHGFLFGIHTLGFFLIFAVNLSLAQGVPSELKKGEITYREITGIGLQKGIERQDPANVLKSGDTYFVWYTQREAGVHPYASTIYYATSGDGIHWKDQGEALGKGKEGQWDAYGVITPYVAYIDDMYYLFYTGTGDNLFRGDSTLRFIGIATSDNPHGPWEKEENNPVLSPGKPDDAWDAVLVDDAHLIVRNGEFWLYYKGRNRWDRPSESKWGLAIAKDPLGPYEKYRDNPVMRNAHTVCVWPHREGVGALVDVTNTIQYANDGIHFKVVKKLDDVATGCGPFNPEAFTGTSFGTGIQWGVAQDTKRVTPGAIHIVRFECNLTVPEK